MNGRPSGRLQPHPVRPGPTKNSCPANARHSVRHVRRFPAAASSVPLPEVRHTAHQSLNLCDFLPRFTSSRTRPFGMSGLTTTSPSFLPILQVRCHFVSPNLAGLNAVHPPWAGMFPHLSHRIPGFCTDIRRFLHIPTGTGYRTSEHRPRISEPCVTKPGRPRELIPWPQSARKVTSCPRIRKWNSGWIRRA